MMEIEGVQVSSAGGEASPQTEQEEQVGHGMDGGPDSAGQDGSRATLKEKVVVGSPPSPLASVLPMAPSVLDARVLQSPGKALPLSMVEGGNDPMVVNLLQQVLSHLGHSPISAAPPDDSPAGDPAMTPAPEQESAPDGPTTAAGAVPTSNAPPPLQRKRTWRQCPDPLPYVEGATLLAPLSDLDLRDAIRVKTGHAPSFPALQNRLWKLANEGKIGTFIRDASGNLVPHRVRSSKFRLYVVRTEADNRASQPAAHLEPPKTSPEPGCGGPITEGTQDASAPTTSPAGTFASTLDPVPEAAPEAALPLGDLADLLRQLGGKKVSLQIEF